MKDYEKRPIFKSLRGLFFDTSNREKMMPLFESVIVRRLEDQYTTSEINYALLKMQDEKLFGQKRLFMKEEIIKKIGKVKFYYPVMIEANQNQRIKINEKIVKFRRIIRRYSNNKNTAMLGKHLHYLIKIELRAQGFDIVDENTNKYEEEISKSQHTLDIIAKHRTKNIIIGIEAKNSLDLISREEIRIKIEMCKSMKIIPVFACRWLKPLRHMIRESGGFPWEFKKQLYPLGQENLVKILTKKFGLPVEVAAELPSASVIDFQNWIQKLR